MARSRCSPRGTPRWRKRSSTWPSTLIHGVSELDASWNTSCGRPAPSAHVAEPDSGFDRPAAMRRVVVLPQPLSPTSATDPRAGTVRLTACTALSRNRIERRPAPGEANDMLTLSSTSAGGASLVVRSTGRSGGAVRSVTGTASSGVTGWKHATAPTPVGRSPISGSVSEHDASAYAQRGANAQPGSGFIGLGGSPGSGLLSVRSPSIDSRAASSALVYGCDGWASTSAAGPTSHRRPAYMTAMRSATDAATPRSWVTSSTAHPCSRRMRSNNSTIWACTLTSRAVVGSSAITSRGAPSSS